LRALDLKSSPLEGFGEAAIAEAQLRPGAAGGENDARDSRSLRHDPAAIGLEHLAVQTSHASILIVLVV